MRSLRVLLLIALLIVAASAVWFLPRMEHERPDLTFPEEIRAVGAGGRTLAFTVEDRKLGLREVTVTLSQGRFTKGLLEEQFPRGLIRGKTKRREFSVPIDAAALGLKEGTAVLAITARDWSIRGGRGNTTLREIPIVVDTTPPRIGLRATENHVNQGGAGVAVFSTSEPVVTAGAKVGDLFFQAYPRVAGETTSWVAYFALPQDAPAGSKVFVEAADLAGNEARAAYPYTVHPKTFRSDTITLSDGFLEAKMPEFAAADPTLGSDPEAIFLTVNRDWRARNHEKFREIAASSRPERLWRGAFLAMPNTKNMAGWADRRTYVRGGRVVDTQTHLGLDLASTAGAPVPAANDGVVAFTGDLGIYGQTVVLDHGQGVMTGYSHLSSIGVAQGQTVKRGDALGASGQTGMAGGDHLHFSVLVGGVFVSPLEWIDQHWIADNIESKIGG